MNELAKLKKEFNSIGVQIMDASSLIGFHHELNFTSGDPEYAMIAHIPMHKGDALKRLFKLKWIISEHEKTGEDLLMLALRYEENILRN